MRAAFDIIRESTAAIDTERKRVLSIKTLDSFGYHWLVPRLHSYSQRFPNVDVRILSSDLEDDALAKGVVDLDIRYGDGDWADVESVRFLTESIFPVCSPQLITVTAPLRTPEDLRHHTLLARCHGDRLARLARGRRYHRHRRGAWSWFQSFASGHPGGHQWCRAWRSGAAPWSSMRCVVAIWSGRSA